MKYRRQRLQRENKRKYPRYAAKNENYSKNRPENRKMGFYEPNNAIFRPIFRFFGLTGMKIQKMKALNKALHRTAHKVRCPVNADVHMAEGKSMGQSSPVFHFQSFLGSEI